jgi:hypothetical protein
MGIGNPGIYFITICSKNREKIFGKYNQSSVVEALASSIKRNILFSNLKTGEKQRNKRKEAKAEEKYKISSEIKKIRPLDWIFSQQSTKFLTTSDLH